MTLLYVPTNENFHVFLFGSKSCMVPYDTIKHTFQPWAYWIPHFGLCMHWQSLIWFFLFPMYVDLHWMLWRCSYVSFSLTSQRTEVKEEFQSHYLMILLLHKWLGWNSQSLKLRILYFLVMEGWDRYGFVWEHSENICTRNNVWSPGTERFHLQVLFVRIPITNSTR